MFFEEEFDISSNNFNKNVSPSLDVCGAANEDAEADVSGNNNELGEIHLSNCNDNYEVDGNKNSDEGCYEDAEDGVPSLKSQYETPSPYVSKNPNVIMNESNRISWDDPTNPCPGDGGDPFVQPETQSGEDLEWSDSGNPVCVAKGESEFIPKSTNNSGNNLQDPSSNGDGVIQTENGDRANIEVRGGDVQWKGGGGLHGDLYNTTGDDIEIDGGGYEFDGDIFAEGGGEIDIESNSGGNDDVFHGNVLVEDGELEVDGNNHIFNGALVTLGENDIDIMGNNNEIYGNSEGIAINATGDLDFGYNNTTVEGIIRGTEIGIDNNGGGNLSMEGMILSNQFDWEPNSGSTRVVKDTTKYSRSVLDKGKWGGTKQNPVNVPAFANVSVKLID